MKNKNILSNITSISYQSYANKVEELSFYPYHKQNSLFSLMYPILGIIGETSELFSIPNDSNDYEERFIKELGDVSWYVFALASEVGYNMADDIDDLSYNIDSPFEKMIEISGRISEHLKKTLRDSDGVLAQDTVKKIVDGLKEFSYCLRILATDGLNTEYGKVLAVNVAKLESRKARGVLKGSGDNR